MNLWKSPLSLLTFITLLVVAQQQPLLQNGDFAKPVLTTDIDTFPTGSIPFWTYSGDIIMAYGKMVSVFWTPTCQVAFLNNYDSNVTLSQTVNLLAPQNLLLGVCWSGFTSSPSSAHANVFWNTGFSQAFTSTQSHMGACFTQVVPGVVGVNTLKFVGAGNNGIYGVVVGKLTLTPHA